MKVVTPVPVIAIDGSPVGLDGYDQPNACGQAWLPLSGQWRPVQVVVCCRERHGVFTG